MCVCVCFHCLLLDYNVALFLETLSTQSRGQLRDILDVCARHTQQTLFDVGEKVEG